MNGLPSVRNARVGSAVQMRVSILFHLSDCYNLDYVSNDYSRPLSRLSETDSKDDVAIYDNKFKTDLGP